jgi:hypothetical protein
MTQGTHTESLISKTEMEFGEGSSFGELYREIANTGGYVSGRSLINVVRPSGFAFDNVLGWWLTINQL